MRLQVPEGNKGLAADLKGLSYLADENGVIEVPDENVPSAIWALGYYVAGVAPVAPISQPQEPAAHTE